MKIYISYFAGQKKMELDDTAYMSIAVGNPRYPVPYKIINLDILKPYGIFRVYHGEEYRKKYYERLDSYGVEKIRKTIDELREGHENVILMCHEKNKYECHRQMFAEWWKERTGEEIEEYGEKKVSAKMPEVKKEDEKDENKYKQLTIFDM